MNIEKIKNYNQKLLAVLGTVFVLIAIVVLIIIAEFAMSEIVRMSRRNNQDAGVLSDDKIEKLQQKNKRQQLISYEMPRLIDTLNMVYIIPVSHKTLNSAESIDNGEPELLGLLESSKIDRSYSRQYYGDFNNLLVYDLKKGKIKKLFSDRVNFSNIRTVYFSDDILLLLKVSTNDTYKDGVINQQDYKTLFIYSLKDKVLKEVGLENGDVEKVDFVKNSKDLLIEFGIDHNKDGKFDKYTEPTVIRYYDYKIGALKSIVGEELNKELQRKLEGSEK